MEAYLPLLAVIIDRLVGDPRSSLHPVVMIGNLIAFFERKLLKLQHSSLLKNVTGGVLVVLVLGITYGTSWWIMNLLGMIHPWAQFIGGAILLSFTIAPDSLAKAGNEIHRYLVTGDLKQAQYKVGWIVGRDTDQLDVAEVTRATVETIAENIVDGIISPLFYFMIGGVPLAFLYRAVNTLDSMVGYKNDKYRDFGMCSARVDDVFNYIPARVTGILLVLSAILLRLNVYGTITAIWRDAAKHPSPNSGFAEAGVAGALGIRLGGLNYYGGVASQRAYMGTATTVLGPIHIKQTIQMMYVSTMLFTIGITIFLFMGR
ncbi:adenosylcobinamide-phosphate synthase CbiB [Pelosinus sp. sgz500959]|uniref:adenosylcobinamide-phosphate synthase CbiB n=1 Tax=Pelosinus sp. sgz500959 TaxID=3242472 RepID=UPI00366B9294